MRQGKAGQGRAGQGRAGQGRAAERDREARLGGRKGERLGTSRWAAACMSFVCSDVRCWHGSKWAGPCSPRGHCSIHSSLVPVSQTPPKGPYAWLVLILGYRHLQGTGTSWGGAARARAGQGQAGQDKAGQQHTPGQGMCYVTVSLTCYRVELTAASLRRAWCSNAQLCTTAVTLHHCIALTDECPVLMQVGPAARHSIITGCMF